VSHPGAERLAALADGGLLESEAEEVRAHLEGCAACRDELEALTALTARVAALPPPGPSAALVAARATRPRRPARLPLALSGAGLAAAAVVVVVLAQPPEFQARGAHERPRAVHAQIFRAGEVRLADGDRAPGELELSVRVSSLGGEGRFACVARDAAGRVTWLHPAWTSGAAPALVEVGGAPAIFGGETAVRLPSPSPGPLELLALVLEDEVDATALDGKLESGWRPVEGREGVRAVQRMVVFVESGR